MEEIALGDIRRKVKSALGMLFEKDAFLFQNDLNERTITHRFAMYLQLMFSDWNVDCEYNRNHDVKKELQFPVESISNDDTQAKTVFPDIIVHHRNTDDNLLVIEVKKSTNPFSDKDDLQKLALFKEQLNYRYAVFFRFTTREEAIGVEMGLEI